MRYEFIQVGTEIHTAAITNHSLSIGEKYGLINGSLLSDFLDCNNLKAVIYLSIIGANKHVDLSFDTFMRNYAPEQELLKKQYSNLILFGTDVKPNKFAEGLDKSTDKSPAKDQKKQKPPHLNIECVEDRYVLYCLSAGIDSDIFWYYPIADVERIYNSKRAYDGWRNSPKTY